MTEQETKQSLLSICEILKMQTQYYWDVHRSMLALYKTMLSEKPDLQPLYHSHWKELDLRGPAAFGNNTAELIQKLDEIIQRLKE